jgi:hypothetical protein
MSLLRPHSQGRSLKKNHIPLNYEELIKTSQITFEIKPRIVLGVLGCCSWGPSALNCPPPPHPPTFRTHVNNPVSGFDDFKVVFDHNDSIALVYKALNHLK